MAPRSLILRFLGGFVFAYALLILPWPGGRELYARYFRTLGRLAFAQEGSRRILRLEPFPAGSGHSLDTQIMLANRGQLDAAGTGPVRILELDTHGVGWVPTALLLALILATPVSRGRRGRALFWGLLWIHAFILFSLGVYIWNESAALSLVTLTPCWKTVADGLEETLITQMGASFVVPVLIWIPLIFRRQDFGRMAGLQPAGEKAVAHHPGGPAASPEIRSDA